MQRRSFLLYASSLVPAVLAVNSCSAPQSNNAPPPRDGTYYPEQSFILSLDDFSYASVNALDPNNEKRSEANLGKHRPALVSGKNGRDFFVSFGSDEARHPHEKGHYWKWVEFTSLELGQAQVIELPEPGEEESAWGPAGQNLRLHFTTFSPLSGLVRIRAWCSKHGLYTDYIQVKR